MSVSRELYLVFNSINDGSPPSLPTIPTWCTYPHSPYINWPTLPVLLNHGNSEIPAHIVSSRALGKRILHTNSQMDKIDNANSIVVIVHFPNCFKSSEAQICLWEILDCLLDFFSANLSYKRCSLFKLRRAKTFLFEAKLPDMIQYSSRPLNLQCRCEFKFN